jgi:hypothetical protein
VIVRRRKGDLKRSFDVYMMDCETAVYVGSTSTHTWYDEIKPDEAAIAEVNYLYASEDRRLIQPQLQRLRDDKEIEGCVSGHLVIGKKFQDD